MIYITIVKIALIKVIMHIHICLLQGLPLDYLYRDFFYSLKWMPVVDVDIPSQIIQQKKTFIYHILS